LPLNFKPSLKALRASLGILCSFSPALITPGFGPFVLSDRLRRRSWTVRLPLAVRLGFISTKSDIRFGSEGLLAITVYCPSGIPGNSSLPESFANPLLGKPLLGVRTTNAPPAGLPFGNETWTYMVESLIGSGILVPPPCPWQMVQAESASTRVRMNRVEALMRHGSRFPRLPARASNHASLIPNLIEKKS